MTTPVLTIGIPSFADTRVWDVLVHMRRDARMHGVVGQFDVVIVENSPDSVQGRINAKTAKGFGAKFVAMPDPVGTAPPRNRIFAEAETEWVLVIDSHVYLDFDVLPKLLAWCRDNHSLDLHYGPLLNSTQIRGDGSLSVQWTHWSDNVGGDGMYGSSANNPAAALPGAEPFLIPHAGCGLFLARREAWLGFHPQMRGFGVEGYLGRKYWHHGRKVWCQPWLRWMHWFRDKTLGVPFPAGWRDRTCNLVLAWQELKHPRLADIRAHHVEKPGRTSLGEWQAIMEELQIDEVAAIAAESGQAPAPTKPQTPEEINAGYLERFPCKARSREPSGVILCNRGCPSERKTHPLFDCRVHGLAVLSNVRSDLQACVTCTKREDPHEKPAAIAAAPAKAPPAPRPAAPAPRPIPEPPNETIRWSRTVHTKPARPDLVIVGNAGLGSGQMRGRAVAVRLGAQFVDCNREPIPKAKTILLVKSYPPESFDTVHRACERLIYDPLDVFYTEPRREPVGYWREVRNDSRCAVMLATSPAAAELMTAAEVAPVVVAPHHADERIGGDWYRPDGPVVYAGLREFLGDELPAIQAACEALGRKFVARHDHDCWEALDGAALVLTGRFGRTATPLNKSCKPAIKVANAARAGIPVLSSDDPAVTSLCQVTLTTGDWQADIARALEAPPPVYPWNLETHCALIRSLVTGRPAEALPTAA